jgi:molecular chaperone DnaK
VTQARYLGIDLGTTNSAVAVFKDSKVSSLLTPLGQINTPSIVRILEQGAVVGDKAKRWLQKDPQNTFREFKRLMGTETTTAADSQGKQWLPDELSAEVLKSLKKQAEQAEGCAFDKVVVTVPALFELPQSKATANAARLAGFDKVELLPEPVASGLAAGWNDDQNGKAWLVYDLGGGTFDVSLLESRDGLLRVVAHDGDNFLGGRDIDRIIVAWLKEVLESEFDINLKEGGDSVDELSRYLVNQAENAKIRLSTVSQTLVEIETEFDGQEIELDIPFSEAKLTELCGPLIQKSIDICLRLLKSQGLDLNLLAKVVLVGGPAHMPLIQKAVIEQLAPLAETNEDPMSLVSHGAALYSATLGLACEPALAETEQKTKDHQLWLQFPSICSELSPSIMGRIIDPSFKPKALKLLNLESAWLSPETEVDDSGIFILDASIRTGQSNNFKLLAFDANGNEIPVSHPKITIVHGITMSDPPLARSVGVALADGWVKTFIDRGTPLPAKRTFSQSTVDTLSPGSGQQLIIPIVQGERRKARFCRSVGSLIIEANDLKKMLTVGSSVEITIEVDRGGDLKAQAFLPDQNKLIEGVAHLVMENQSFEAIQTLFNTLSARVNKQSTQAFKDRDLNMVDKFEPLVAELESVRKRLGQKQDDADNLQQLARSLQEIEAQIEQIEGQDQLVDLIEECQDKFFNTQASVNDYGDDMDRRVLDDCAKQLENAMKHSRQGELERLLERLESISHSAHRKSPFYFLDLFNYWASFASSSSNPKRSQKLIEQGNALIHKEEYKSLKPIVDELYELTPHQLRGSGENTYDSGIY